MSSFLFVCKVWHSFSTTSVHVFFGLLLGLTVRVHFHPIVLIFLLTIISLIVIHGQFLMRCNGAEALTRAHTQFIWWTQSARWLLTLRPIQPTWAMSLPLGSCHPHPPSLCIITQPEGRYSFYCPTEGRKLSRSRHCRKCATVHSQDWLYRCTPLSVVWFEPGFSHAVARCHH